MVPTHRKWDLINPVNSAEQLLIIPHVQRLDEQLSTAGSERGEKGPEAETRTDRKERFLFASFPLIGFDFFVSSQLSLNYATLVLVSERMRATLQRNKEGGNSGILISAGSKAWGVFFFQVLSAESVATPSSTLITCCFTIRVTS